MRLRFAASTAVAVAAVSTVAAAMIATGSASGHGTSTNPVSRVYGCYLEGPESPDTPACQAAVAAGGTQALYDWNEINQAAANGQHRTLIPDGKLCSANRAKYAAFDAPRTDWPTTTLPTSGSYTFQFRATAPHVGTFEFYATKQGYSATSALKWSDLDATPFLRVTNPVVSNGYYTITGHLPTGRTGRHLIYIIWQRSDSTEAFYSCSDVIFGSAPPTSTPPSPSASASVSPSASASPSPSRSTSPSVSPSASKSPSASPSTSTGTYAAWVAGKAYAIGNRVGYAGKNYECIQAHTSLNGWEPPNVAALWKLV
ncbi:chitin-binding protein [Allocatelliglobosispora scoriae]|uniref:Chitin-binding protein n=1 Tax=Allocatelliglobosispora scoriae TaxID=643052 RepID=A0A841C0J9_9ACTN|nr:lytic polysaccharide monooxygenase [Allocatelliglobosispora scoriae]MBB5872480.1 chitin-binding protein [Allocatelliglobosispora scoriae]